MPETWASTVPRLAANAEFVPWEDVGDAPHVVVDGPRRSSTVLGLSHWPDGDAPPQLAADTSTEIAARYVDLPPAGAEVAVVTNNHFDEDGLLAAWVALNGEGPGPRRELAIGAAEAGDFHTWRDPWGARCAIALMAMAERATTPFPEVVRALNRAGGHDPAGALSRVLLPRVASLLDDPERFRLLWAPRWAAVEADIATLDAGEATIEEIREADLAVIRTPRPLDRLATHPRTDRMRVLTATPDGLLVLEHRYETWVRFASRALTPRSDLTPVLRDLQAMERGPGTWRFEGVQCPLARLAPVDANGAPAPSSIDPLQLAAALATPGATPAGSR